MALRGSARILCPRRVPNRASDMAALALTDLLCRNAKAPDTGRVELADAKCPGLVLRVAAAGAKSWAVRY